MGHILTWGAFGSGRLGEGVWWKRARIADIVSRRKEEKDSFEQTGGCSKLRTDRQLLGSLKVEDKAENGSVCVPSDEPDTGRDQNSQDIVIA